MCAFARACMSTCLKSLRCSKSLLLLLLSYYTHFAPVPWLELGPKKNYTHIQTKFSLTLAACLLLTQSGSRLLQKSTTYVVFRVRCKNMDIMVSIWRILQFHSSADVCEDCSSSSSSSKIEICSIEWKSGRNLRWKPAF